MINTAKCERYIGLSRRDNTFVTTKTAKRWCAVGTQLDEVVYLRHTKTPGGLTINCVVPTEQVARFQDTNTSLQLTGRSRQF